MPLPEIPPEGAHHEWKERLPRADRLARVLCAFANGGGGTLWIGVHDDGGVCGVEDVADVRAGLEATLDLVEPRPRVDLRRHRLEDGRTLVEVRVRPSEGERAVAEVLDRQGGRRAYLRDRDRTQPMDAAARRHLEHPPARTASLDEKDRRLLELLARHDGLPLKELARMARGGERSVRRRLVELVRGGLVLHRDDRCWSLTPKGRQRSGGGRRRG